MYLKPKVKAPFYELIAKTKDILDRWHTNTICIESNCPNISECFFQKSATFLILGDICTRNCKFCNVVHAKPKDIDRSEPKRVAQAIKELGLEYVVITSVDRDDLKDLGVRHFVNTIQEIKRVSPRIKIEVLTPDFKAKKELLDRIIEAKPFKLAHNIETVRSISKKIMPGCSYDKSMEVLAYYIKSLLPTKSSIMVGLGERIEELEESFRDLASIGLEELTIGQYLQPSPSHWPVHRYYTPQEFDELASMAQKCGIQRVKSGILVRSSYNAKDWS